MTRLASGRHRRPLVAVALLSLLVAACSTGSASDDGVASLASPGTAAATASPEASLDAEDAMLAFAQCMRDNGIDMPDPKAGGGFVRVGGPGERLVPGGRELVRVHRGEHLGREHAGVLLLPGSDLHRGDGGRVVGPADPDGVVRDRGVVSHGDQCPRC